MAIDDQAKANGPQTGRAPVSDTCATRPRLAIILSHPTQYYSPWFRWLAAHSDLELRVFYLSDAGVRERTDPGFGVSVKWDVDLLSGYASEFVPNRSPRPHTDTFFGLVNPSTPSRIARFKPDALLMFGYRFASHLMILAWARIAGIPVIFRGDSHLLGRPQPRTSTRLMLSTLYRQFAAFACVGQANRAYFTAFGAPEHKLFTVPHCVDQSHFKDPDGSHADAAHRLRRELGIPAHHKVVLFAGKFRTEKNPDGLLDAFIALAPANASLVFVGDGPLAPALRARASAAPTLPIHFLPFANQREMPSRLLLGDLFCLPSLGLYETWGLAINEAMHLGRPCLVSDLVGCQRDLVHDGKTGWVFQAATPASLATKLKQALEAPLPVIGAAAQAHAANYSYEQAGTGLQEALRSCTPAARRKNT